MTNKVEEISDHGYNKKGDFCGTVRIIREERIQDRYDQQSDQQALKNYEGKHRICEPGGNREVGHLETHEFGRDQTDRIEPVRADESQTG